MVELIKQAIADNSKVGNMMSTYIDKKMMGRLLTRILRLLLSVRYTNKKYLNMISVD